MKRFYFKLFLIGIGIFMLVPFVLLLVSGLIDSLLPDEIAAMLTMLAGTLNFDAALYFFFLSRIAYLELDESVPYPLQTVRSLTQKLSLIQIGWLCWVPLLGIVNLLAELNDTPLVAVLFSLFALIFFILPPTLLVSSLIKAIRRARRDTAERSRIPHPRSFPTGAPDFLRSGPYNPPTRPAAKEIHTPTLYSSDPVPHQPPAEPIPQPLHPAHNVTCSRCGKSVPLTAITYLDGCITCPDCQ